MLDSIIIVADCATRLLAIISSYATDRLFVACRLSSAGALTPHENGERRMTPQIAGRAALLAPDPHRKVHRRPRFLTKNMNLFVLMAYYGCVTL